MLSIAHLKSTCAQLSAGNLYTVMTLILSFGLNTSSTGAALTDMRIAELLSGRYFGLPVIQQIST